MQHKIIPNLWFDTEAEEAAAFYTSVFENSHIVNVTHYPEAGPRAVGTVMTVEFELDGQRFVGINGGPQFTFDEAVSFQITCETRTRSTSTGSGCPRAGRKGRAAGSRTATACPGRSYRPGWRSCSPILTRSGPSARCRRCSRWASSTSPRCAARPTAPRRADRHLSDVVDSSMSGGCLCGGVRFALTEAAPAAGYCHCSRCQRRTGTSASAQARIDGRTFRLLQGEELVKAWRHTTLRS